MSLSGLSRHNSERSSQNLQQTIASNPAGFVIGDDNPNTTAAAAAPSSPSPHPAVVGSNGSIQHPHLSRCPTYPIPLQDQRVQQPQLSEPKLKGILKKSSSSQDVSISSPAAEGYVQNNNSSSSTTRLLLDVAPLAQTSTSDMSSNASSIAEDSSVAPSLSYNYS